MGEDWQVGDLALCVCVGTIKSDWGLHTGLGLVRGKIYEVVGVDVCPRAVATCLFLKDDAQGRDRGSRLSSRFRKIRPHTPDEQDAETIRLLNGAPAEREPVTVEGGR